MGQVDASGVLQVQMEAVSRVEQMSTDHKPSDPAEFKRIVEAGGYVYQT